MKSCPNLIKYTLSVHIMNCLTYGFRLSVLVMSQKKGRFQKLASSGAGVFKTGVFFYLKILKMKSTIYSILFALVIQSVYSIVLDLSAFQQVIKLQEAQKIEGDCISNQVVVRFNDRCGCDQICGNGLTCTLGVCKKSDGEVCINDTDCVSGKCYSPWGPKKCIVKKTLICTDGICKKPDGEVCSDNTDCASGKCSPLHGTQKCVADNTQV